MQITQTTPTTPSAAAATTADDPRSIFATALSLAGGVIGAVRPEQLDGPTPCTEFDVRQVLTHLVEVLHRVAALGRGGNPFAVDAPQGVADDGWLDAWVAAAHEAQAAWSADAVLEREMTLPWIQAPGRFVLLGYVSEVTVHTWDLATATGQSPAWDDQVVEAAYRSIQAGLPAENREAMFEAVIQGMPPELRTFAAPFLARVPTPPDAPLIDRLVAWTGRRP